MKVVMAALVLVGGLVILAAVPLTPKDKEANAPASPRPPETRAVSVTPDVPPEFQVAVTPEMARHSRILDTLYFAGFFYGCLVLLVILATGLSRRMRDLAVRWGRRPFVAAMIFFALFSLASSILSFPLDFYSDYVVNHQFNLSNQNFPQWLWEYSKQFAIGLVIGAPLLALTLMAMRKMPKRWWLAVWFGSIPITIFLIVLQPVVLDPMFNKFVPLRNAALRDKLLDEASRAGISGGRVYEVDKSKQTKTMNAYVNGIGPTARIVMWDTLLAKMNDEEVLFVMGHEMGHYVMKHIWKGLAFTMAVIFFVLLGSRLVLDQAVARFGRRWGFESPSDPAAVPLLLLILSVMIFILSPVFSGYSRRTEHQADVFALELTHSNEAGARSFMKLAEDSKVDPNPSRFIEFWRYSHPALSRRIEFALNYRPWETGKPNQMWKR